jgi:hypothetical protein
MAEIPAAAVTAATRAIVATAHDFGADGLVAIDYAKAARAAVGAAAPYFRHQVTQAAIDNVQHLAAAAQAKVAEHAHDVGYLQGVSEGTEAERERIRQLAITEADRLRGGNFGPRTADVKALHDFADLLDGDGNG